MERGGRRTAASEIESVAVVVASSSSGSSPARSLGGQPPSSPPSPSSSSSFILHRVTKMDTLAGLAIKYGVEVADIRRLNGLSTDLQMFAHKMLRIPLHGRHPPSHYESNGSDITREQTPPRRPHEDILNSLQSLKLKPPRHQKVSPAMSLLQGYYGLSPPPKAKATKKEQPQTEMTSLSLKQTKSLCLDEDPLFLNHLSNSEPPPNRHRKSLSLQVNGDGTEESDYDKKIRRRQKVDVSPEKLSSSSSKPLGLPLRPKHSQQNLTAMGGDPLIADGFLTVRKSSSTSDLQDSDTSLLSKWSLKPDSFALPIFDSLPNPIATWRNKAARD